MYDKHKLKKLLKYPLDNFNKLVKLYCKHLTQFYRIKFGKINDKDELKEIKTNIDNIEDEFDLVSQLEPYLELNDIVEERVSTYIKKAAAIPTFGTLYKALISYREKTKWGTVVFSDDHSSIIVYLPNESTILTFIDPSGKAYTSQFSQSPTSPFGPTKPLINPLNPNIFTGPNGPDSPPHGPMNPIPHGQLLNYMFSNSHGYNRLAIRYSPYELYYGLLNYIEITLLNTNSHLFPMLRYMDPRAITLNDLIAMNRAVTMYFNNNMLDPSYNAKVNIVNYAIKLHCLVVQSLLHFNPTKNYRFPGLPIAIALQDSVHYRERYVVSIGEQINGYRC